jgi:hypothetical protein
MATRYVDAANRIQHGWCGTAVACYTSEYALADDPRSSRALQHTTLSTIQWYCCPRGPATGEVLLVRLHRSSMLGCVILHIMCCELG